MSKSKRGGEIVYHGTSPLNLLQIRKDGLCHGLPDSFREFVLLGREEVEDAIYVTTDPQIAIGFSSLFPRREHSRRSKIKEKQIFSIIRFNLDEARKAGCYIKNDRGYHRSFKIKCEDKCFKPNAEICFVKGIRGENKLLQFMNCKWRQLIYKS